MIASSTSIQSGNSVTLSWSSTNATICTASGGWTGSKATIGIQLVSNLTTTTEFTLTCTGAGGSTTDSVQVGVYVVDPEPSITVLSPNGGEVYKRGQQINIKWESKNIEKVKIILSKPEPLNSGVIGARSYIIGDVSANQNQFNWTIPINSNIISNWPSGKILEIPGTDFKINVVKYDEVDIGDTSDGDFSIINDITAFCPTGTTGTYPNCVKIVCPAGTTGTYPNCVPTPATLTFTVSPINVYLGNNITLSWITTRVGICQASGDWSGYKDVSGSEKINVNSLGYKTYNLSCKNEGGPLSVDKSVTINSTQNPLYPTGCSSNSGYSVITGLSCANTNTNNNTNTNVTNTASSDKTPRVSIWGTKLSQYLNDQGFWVTDLNSGYVHTNEILRFCKKWYPTTTSVEYYKEEYIPNWVNLSTGANETFYSNHFSYKCVGGTHSGPSKVLGVSTSIEASVSNLPTCSLSKNLMKGMQDEEVKCLQEKLNNKGYNVKGTENRKEITFFGYNTLLALKKFQKDNNLKSDGILGLSSRKLLNE